MDALTSDLALRMAAAVAPAPHLSVELSPDDPALYGALVARLQSHGLKVVTAARGVPAVRASCISNLRERACSAEIRLPERLPGAPVDTNAGATRYVIVATRAHDVGPEDARTGLALVLQPLLAQRTPILDVARADDALLVLTPTALIRHEDADGSWRAVTSRPIAVARAWPRDMRGRLQVDAPNVEAFLPGVKCAGRLDPFTWTCAESAGVWPLDIENASLDPERNYFTTSSGLTFYGIARVGKAAGARWAAATIDRVLAFVDSGHKAAATSIAADDVAAVAAPCAPAEYIVAASPAPDAGGDVLTLYAVTGTRVMAAASPLALPGRLTALWPGSSAASATIVTHDPDAGRYDAYQLTVSCSR